MSVILSAAGLSVDKSYALQVRAVFNNGSTSEWGPTFSIVKRTISGIPIMRDYIPSQSGIKVSWDGDLDASFGEEWLVKKFDIDDQNRQPSSPTEATFDSSGTQIYRGSLSKSIDVDLKQERSICFAVTKIDRYGNRSAIDSKILTFDTPTLSGDVSLVNSSGGVVIEFNRSTSLVTDKYHIVKVKSGEPFKHYKVTGRSKSNNICSLNIDPSHPITGETIQVDIGAQEFDGIFQIHSVPSPDTITYLSPVDSNIPFEYVSGFVIPTSSGPADEGLEIYRSEILETSEDLLHIDYTPTISGQPLYIAVGTEDQYKNLSVWHLGNKDNTMLVYGRNYIADRDSITLSSTGNRTQDSIWKYGYIGWNSIHDSFLELNTSTLNGAIKIDSVTTDDPDSIRIGVVNGSSSALPFSVPGETSHTRIYPSEVNELTVVSSEDLSNPVVDDSFFANASGDNINYSSLGRVWADLNERPIGLIWTECSASDILDDTIDTLLPISLDSVSNLTGSFTIKPENWGGISENPQASLKLFAVGGTWDSSRPSTVYDPHFDPLYEFGHTRSIKHSYTVTNVSKTSNTITLVLAPGETVYPSVGDSITVSVGNINIDGTFIVSTGGSTVSYYGNNATAVGSVARTGTAVINFSQTYTVTNKYKNSTNVARLTLTDTSSLSIGQFIDVGIGDLAFDGSSYQITDIIGLDIYYIKTGAAIASTPVSSRRIVVREVGVQPVTSLIKSWEITKRPEDGQFLSDGTPIEKTYTWNWNTTTNTDIKTLRFVWVLEFDQNKFADTGAGGGSAWVPGTSYLIKLANFQAWPGINPYANLGEKNEFSEPQTFLDSVVIRGPLYVDGDTRIEGSLNVLGQSFTAYDANVQNLIIDNDLQVLDGKVIVNGDPIHTASTIYHYTDDFPHTGAGLIAQGVNTPNTINSIKITPPVTEAGRWLAIVSWSGSFIGATNNRPFTFKLWKWNTGASPGWVNLRVSGGIGPRPSGSMVHYSQEAWSSGGDELTWAVSAEQENSNATINGMQNASTSPQQDTNKLSVILIPTNNLSGGTIYPPASPFWSPGPLFTYPHTGAGNGGGGKVTKDATISIVGGWKNSYTGDGTSQFYDGGPIQQGYIASKGNQKSAWGFGAKEWDQVTGNIFTPGTIVPDSIKIINCILKLKATNWGETQGGTAVIGTHGDAANDAVSNWSNLTDKRPDRKREDFAGLNTKDVDLGIEIGKEIWNGHARLHLPGTADPAGKTGDATTGSQSGIIFGPAPSSASRFEGAFSATELKVTMKVQWLEEG